MVSAPEGVMIECVTRCAASSSTSSRPKRASSGAMTRVAAESNAISSSATVMSNDGEPTCNTRAVASIG
ncbi:Uncharacterised protein [Mycobacteroides abscessus subsp. abscessus]|nr:Uncharacterised protein [Mycobacteroides abscessus subsp. abscessus]